ncbi:dTDP-4-dehydrorhamnose 3,5-epimerase family protein [Flavobacteriaceae bacterium]|nr:dTDP-4-dehydrorhamnose 3,5-epimerase family protein [Flavobacteriaceae bacterium]
MDILFEGISFYDLKPHKDERGFFMEIGRLEENNFFKEGVLQVSHSYVNTGIEKGWHSHKIQTQWNYVISGIIEVELIDLRVNSKTYLNKVCFTINPKLKPTIYKFDKMIGHRYRVIKELNIVYFTSGVYDLNDEIRHPLNMF